MNTSNPEPTIDPGYPTEPHGRIPSFNSIEEEAEFWDTHDVTDFREEIEPVEVNAGPDFGSVLRVPLDGRDIDELGRRADELGVGITDLARVVDRGTPSQGSVAGRQRWHHPCYTSGSHESAPLV